MSTDAKAIRDLAFGVNRDGAVNVARAAKEMGSRLIFLSSDYVFDGTKKTPYEAHDVRNPQSVYGRSKAEAEIRLLELMPDCCIVRTSWLFGTGGKCFPDTILKLAGEPSRARCGQRSARMPDLQRGSGAGASFSFVTRTRAESCTPQTAGDCTWYEFAGEIVRGAGLANRAPRQQPADEASGASSGLFCVVPGKSAQLSGSKCLPGEMPCSAI